MAPLKRSISIAGHKTSLTLEPEFWEAAKTIAKEQSISLAHMIGQVDEAREGNNLSSAVRIYILRHYQNADREPTPGAP